MTPPLEEYHGRLAMVTGAGDGIGKMLAKKFADAGMTVCVQDIREDAASAVASEIGGNAFPLTFDVSDYDQCVQAAGTLERRAEPLCMLWVNAGVGVGAKMTEGSRNAIDWGVAVNIVSPIWTARALRPLMKPGEAPAHIGFTASVASLLAAEEDYPFYAVTKHGTFAVAEAIGAEVGREGITSTILCPGLLNTDIWDGARARPDRFGGEKRMDPSIAEPWRQAKTPDVMWAHIERVVSNGGGYLVCATEDDTLTRFKARAEDIGKAFVQI
ncbi:MAG: SDR family oxidoreductase [Pseudomonadota bacterium]